MSTHVTFQQLLRAPSFGPQINHRVLDTRIQVHMTAEFIDLLPGLCGWVRVEPSVGAVADELHAAGRCQPEDAALAVLAVSGGHDDGHGLFQHHLDRITLHVIAVPTRMSHPQLMDTMLRGPQNMQHPAGNYDDGIHVQANLERRNVHLIAELVVHVH